MFKMLSDACVWLDLAKDQKQAPVFGVLDEMVRLGTVTLIVPRVAVISSQLFNKDSCPEGRREEGFLVVGQTEFIPTVGGLGSPSTPAPCQQPSILHPLEKGFLWRAAATVVGFTTGTVEGRSELSRSPKSSSFSFRLGRSPQHAHRPHRSSRCARTNQNRPLLSGKNIHGQFQSSRLPLSIAP